MAAGVGNTHVLIEVQESLMERQQNKFHFPDCLHPTSCFFKMVSGFAAVIVWYIVLSLLTGKVSKHFLGTVVVLSFDENEHIKRH